MADALYEIPLAQFINKPPVSEEVVSRYYEDRAPEWLVSLRTAIAGSAARESLPSAVPGYLLFRVADRLETIVVIHEASGEIAAAVTHWDFHVWPGHRGRGLGVDILDQAFREGIKTLENTRYHALSRAGLGCRRAVHRRQVERAVAEGVEVSAEVLEDYPELRPAPITMP